ncbi:MAG: carotenoid biosynthesis protein [Hydrococcus sp. C42_A2020_068]|uniref:gamma-carotene 1'-hydroxylase CruF n=1 Tax=Pleurocapsa sp. PCC 7327 TaxID=118163 RepID=UPI00029F831A|nr:carotenoid biosynthesis protein [Pleurocapsa sp. PCC 7327]AFY77524.1 putative membrane protein [Pleurocapsa sp. PCC 7327]MBF2022280.1 carotenoid biosynthesis protein [Hydrococcus sp. C42_A2020_068]
MKPIISAERFLLIGHILSMAFGLAGLLIVLPNPEFVVNLPEFGKTAFAWSMAGGGVVYMLLATAAVAVYAYRTLGLWHWLGFMAPAIALSLCSELLGTSTGFPFGHYRYLTGLGYKVAGLVPFTIPLSWFYLGFSAYLLARAGLESRQIPNWVQYVGAIALGATMLTSWDFVLDPAMSQTTMPFWIWEQPGAFFGMPYQNFAGWLGTGTVFMTVATLLWKAKPVTLPRTQLGLPLAIYLSNFAFATIMSVAAGIYIPVFLGVILGVVPAIAFYQLARAGASQAAMQSSDEMVATEMTEIASVKVPIGVMPE